MHQPKTYKVPYVGKFWRIWRTVGNSPKFSLPIFINARVFNKLPTDSPKFSSPKTLELLIRQNFPTHGNQFLERFTSEEDSILPACFTLSNAPFAYLRKLFVSWVVNTKGVKCGRAAECSTQAYKSFQSRVRRIYYLCKNEAPQLERWAWHTHYEIA